MTAMVYKARRDGDQVVVDWLICASLGQLAEAHKDGWANSEADARAALAPVADAPTVATPKAARNAAKKK